MRLLRKCRLDSLGADSGMPTRIKMLETRSQAFSLPHMHLCTKPGLCTAALPFVSYWKWLLPSRVASQLTCTVEGQQWLRSEQSPSKTAESQTEMEEAECGMCIMLTSAKQASLVCVYMCVCIYIRAYVKVCICMRATCVFSQI